MFTKTKVFHIAISLYVALKVIFIFKCTLLITNLLKKTLSSCGNIETSSESIFRFRFLFDIV